MTNFHAWKRRLWGQNYPIENGPPLLDGSGAPIIPGTGPGPYAGLSDDGPTAPGNPVVLTLAGTTNADGVIIVMLAEADGSWTQVNWIFNPGETAADIASLLALAFDLLNPTGWDPVTTVGGAITFTPDTARTVSGYVLYGPADLKAVQQSHGPANRKAVQQSNDPTAPPAPAPAPSPRAKAKAKKKPAPQSADDMA